MRLFRAGRIRIQLSALILSGMLAILVVNSAYASDGSDKGGGKPEPRTPVRASVSCSGHGCDGKDPSTTGCSSGAYTITSISIPGNGGSALLETRWSPTCKTNWARVVYSSASVVEPSDEIALEKANEDTIQGTYATIIAGYTTQYGYMYYAPTEQVKACYFFNGNPNPSCTGLA